jgi:hypothetical protein
MEKVFIIIEIRSSHPWQSPTRGALQYWRAGRCFHTAPVSHLRVPYPSGEKRPTTEMVTGRPGRYLQAEALYIHSHKKSIVYT